MFRDTARALAAATTGAAARLPKCHSRVTPAACLLASPVNPTREGCPEFHSGIWHGRMARTFFVRAALAVSLFVAPTAACVAAESAAASGEVFYLNRFEGRWSGSGTISFASAAAGIPLRCNVSGQAEGERLQIRGECSGSGFRTKVSASLRYDTQAGTYVGAWSDSATGSAGLFGSRRGETLNLAVTGNAADTGRMTLTAQGGWFRLSLSSRRVASSSESRSSEAESPTPSTSSTLPWLTITCSCRDSRMVRNEASKLFAGIGPGDLAQLSQLAG
jgi:hypothetical protein